LLDIQLRFRRIRANTDPAVLVYEQRVAGSLAVKQAAGRQ
jgi:hypothetical protein